jgi:signal transduction histidine kinase
MPAATPARREAQGARRSPLWPLVFWAVLVGLMVVGEIARLYDVKKPLVRRPATGAFGTSRSSDEPRTVQHARAHEPGRGRHAESLTQRLLAFSRQQPLVPNPVDVGRLVAGMSDLLRRTLGERIAVETVLAGGLWGAFADPNQLEVAIVNLAVNARDAMPSGGKLTIETANVHLDEIYAAAQAEVLPGQYVLLAVSDTGVGMTRM